MAEKLAGIGVYNVVDPTFTAVKPSEETLRLAKANAAPGQTAEQYLASRGGVNAAGYYGDSWNAKNNLTDAEYFKVLNDARAAGKTGAQLGAAINAATMAKQGISGNSTVVTNASGNTTQTTGTNYSGGGTNADPLKRNGANFTGTLGGVNYVNGIKEDTAKRTAQQEFRSALAEFGLGDLADTVDRFIRDDMTVSQIRLELPKTESYKQRFPGMQALREAGQAVSEATYISMEKGYLQTLAAYGLEPEVLGSRKELGTYIANLVSPREFEERVNLAATRVKDNPDVIAQFKTFYPEVDNNALTAYLLNPIKGMDVIKKQVRLAEIGAAGLSAGFKTAVSMPVAEELRGAVGEQDYQTIQQSFEQAKYLADQQSRLARIEGTAYSELEAIRGTVGKDIQSQLASQKRAEREVITRFGGRSGVTSTSLKSSDLI